MRVLVTGGTGFIGSHIAGHFIEQGAEVLITGTTGENTLERAILIKNLGELRHFGTLDAVFHQAALNDTTNLDKNAMFLANVHWSQELFERAIQKGCKHIVYASSTAIYGNGLAPYKEHQPLQPLNPYAESKIALESLAQQYARAFPSLTFVGLRYCNVYGPGEAHKQKRASMIYQLAQQMLQDNPKLFKIGEQKRDYIYVRDVLQANILAAQAKESCVVNCGSGKPTTFNELVNILNEVIGLQRLPEYIENPHHARYQSHTECDMTLAQQKLGFVPQHDIRKGIEQYYRSGALTQNFSNERTS